MVGGGGSHQQLPKGLVGEEEDEEGVKFERRRAREQRRLKDGKRKNAKDKEWILKKKEASHLLSLQRVRA
jgi:18S rRNA (guanine1575-N7)-methyltransferase